MPSPNEQIEDARKRQQQLLEQLAAAPIAEILGVVSPTGASGGKAGREDLWTLKLALDAWRTLDGPVQTRPLTIRRKVTNQELSNYMRLLKPYDVVLLRARVVADSPFGGPEALLEEFVGSRNSDLELNAVARKLQEPVTLEDPLLGTFTLDRRLNQFAGRANWNGKTVELSLHAKEAAEVEAALKTAHALWKDQQLWHQRVGDYAVQRLLPLKNEAWLEEDDDELLPEEFKARMTLDAITVRPNGSFEFWHRDGDMFWGHAVHISGSLARGLTGADTPG